MYIQGQGPLEEIKPEEVRTHVGKMKNNNACGPDELTMEIVKALGQEGEKWMLKVPNQVLMKLY